MYLLSRHGFWLVIELTWLLKLVTTKNYGAISDSRTLFLNTARTNSSQFVSNRRCQVTDPNYVLFCSDCYRLGNVSHITHGYIFTFLTTSQLTQVKVKFVLQPTVSRLVCLGVKPSSRAQDQIFITVKTVVGL
jgi:hypothetical protein